MEDLTRLERVIEATAESETDLQPETRLEKVILETGAKIQEEIEGAGGTLYKHRIQIPYSTTNQPSFDIINDNDSPLEMNDIINYLKDNNFITIQGTDNFNYQVVSGNWYKDSGYINIICGVFYHESSHPNGVRLCALKLNNLTPYQNNFTYSYENNIIDNITEL